MLADTAVTLELLATGALTGIIWLVQLAHYPALRDVGPAPPEFYARNATLTGRVVAPLMVLELVCAAYLFIHTQDILRAVLLAVVVALWIVTFVRAVPLHKRLAERGYERLRVDRLVKRNRTRTTLWTLRAAVLAYLHVAG